CHLGWSAGEREDWRSLTPIDRGKRMAGNVVCQGALCACNQGAAPTPLTVTSQQIRTVAGMLVATIMDFAPVANVKPFGVCQQLTKMAAGVPTPCVPAPVGPWAPGSKVDLVTNFPVLTA